jgi:hypothetical protein
MPIRPSVAHSYKHLILLQRSLRLSEYIQYPNLNPTVSRKVDNLTVVCEPTV